jgi:hypothetical protein
VIGLHLVVFPDFLKSALPSRIRLADRRILKEKTTFMKTITTLKKQIFGLLFVVAFFNTINDVTAQQFYRQPAKLFLGLEAATGPRSFKIDSDIKEIDGQTVNEEGFNFGLMFGINKFHFRANQGFYKASAAVGQRIDMADFFVGANFFPLKPLGKKGKYVKPYLSANINANKITFFGSYALPEPAPATPPPAAALPCPCTCPNSSGEPSIPSAEPLPSSDEPIETELDRSATLPEPMPEEPAANEDRELGSIRSIRADVGAGIMLQLPARRLFMNFFAEAKYGLTLDQQASNFGFSNTKISNPFVINLGVSFGLKN